MRNKSRELFYFVAIYLKKDALMELFYKINARMSLMGSVVDFIKLNLKTNRF
jgi:hypothetical protein